MLQASSYMWITWMWNLKTKIDIFPSQRNVSSESEMCTYIAEILDSRLMLHLQMVLFFTWNGVIIMWLFLNVIFVWETAVNSQVWNSSNWIEASTLTYSQIKRLDLIEIVILNLVRHSILWFETISVKVHTYINNSLYCNDEINLISCSYSHASNCHHLRQRLNS